MEKHGMESAECKWKIAVIIVLIVGISGLHLLITHEFVKGHIVARELYFIPVILSGFWFGLRGALLTSFSVTLFYLPYSAMHWNGFTSDDLDRLLEIALFNVVAVVVGFLQDRQQARNKEKFESIKAMAATVAHEINTPLFVAMGNLELLQDDFEKDSVPYEDIAGVLRSLGQMKELVKKISLLENIVTEKYDGTSVIVNIDQSISGKLSEKAEKF